MRLRLLRPDRCALLTVVLGFALPGRAVGQEEEDADPAGPRVLEKKEDAKKPASDFDLDAEMTVAFTSNVYREQSRRLDDFDSKSDPGERFEGMSGPSDLYARPALAVGWSRKVSSKRRFELSAGAEFTAYARNGIANYVVFAAESAYDVTKRDRLALEVELTPRRFKENYFNDVGGNKVFDRAYYMKLAPTIGYRRDWSKRWATELEYELSLRRFEDPFPHRNTTTHTGLLLLAHEASDRVTVKAGPELAVTSVPRHMEFGAQVDRSHFDLGALAVLELNLRHGWAAEGELGYKRKTYLSDDPADDAHHDRADDRFAAGVAVDKRMSESWYLEGLFKFTKVQSDRVDPTVDADEVGYTELVLGVGGQAQF